MLTFLQQALSATHGDVSCSCTLLRPGNKLWSRSKAGFQLSLSMSLSSHVTLGEFSFLVKIVGSVDFPGSPVVKTPCSQLRGHRFDPWSGMK